MNTKKIVFLSAIATFSLAVNAENSLQGKLQITKNNPITKVQKKLPSDFLSFKANPKSRMHKVTDYDKKAEIKEAQSFGTINGDDGSEWIYTLSATESPTHAYSYGSATINLYDNTNTLVTSITINVPDSMNVNDIEPFGNVSTKFYDTDSKTKEFIVSMHEIGEGYTSIWHFLVYNTKGELVRQYDNLGNIIWFDASEKYDTYQRAIFVTDGVDASGNYTTKMSIMKPATWSSKEPQVEHVFEVRNDLIEYSYGPCLNTYKIDGKPYYMLSYYEKPFVSGYDENYDMILTENNNYCVEVYDGSYNKVSDFKIPVTHPDDAFCSCYTTGIYSYQDLNNGYFSEGFNVVITRMDVRLDTDDDTYPYTFLVYNSDGTLANTIAQNVISWKSLASIRGTQDQVGCICINDGTETLEMINLPECTNAVTFQAQTEGRKISSNYDRYPVGDSYQYVLGMGDAEAGPNNEVIASVGWFKQDGSLDHYVRFNLDVNGEYFTPLLESYSLDPSLVNTDSAHEYIYIAKQRRTDGSDQIENVLIIADENGKEIKRFAGGDEKTLRVASVVDAGIGKPRLVVGFSDNTLGSYDLDFYNLPFEKFSAGGDGSIDNPYIITSAGDMKQIATEPAAHYVLGTNIDMNELADPWTPVSQFSGTLDGRGNAIRNLYIDNNQSYSGLFGYLVNEGSYVKNLYISNPHVTVNSGNNYVGLVAGLTLKTVMDSVYVENPVFEGTGNAMVGGLVGQATYYTTIASDYVKDASFNLPNCSTVGGIAGDTRTASTIDACFVSGELKARTTLGGIVGTTGKDCTVRNCHIKAALEAENNVGGAVGSAGRYEISNNLIEGTIKATNTDMYGNASVGGVAGSLESLWQGTATKIITNNVVALDTIVAPENALAVHRIIGFTISDEQYEEDEKHKTEGGLSTNYAISTLEAYGTKDGSKVDGADVVTLDKAFFESCGFKYGMDSTSPWTGDTLPTLYFESNEAPTGISSVNEDSAKYGISSGSNIFNIYGQRVSANTRGIVIVNGKKMMIK